MRSLAFLTCHGRWRSEWHHQLLLNKWELVIGGLMISHWGNSPFSWLCQGSQNGITSSCWRTGSWQLEKSWFLVEEACFFDHVMEDGVWVVHQVGWGVELNHLPLVQHQDPETRCTHLWLMTSIAWSRNSLPRHLLPCDLRLTLPSYHVYSHRSRETPSFFSFGFVLFFW